MISEEVKMQEIQKEKKGRKRRSIWTKEWIIRYLQFVIGHIKIFEQKRIDDFVFQKMAEYVNCDGKGPTQCYNFHDRMKRKYKSTQNLIKELKEKHDIKSEDLKAQAQKIINTKKELFEQIQMMRIRDNEKLATLKRFKQQGLSIQPEKCQASIFDQERQKSRAQQQNDSVELEQNNEKKYKIFEANVQFQIFVDLQLSRKKQKR